MFYVQVPHTYVKAGHLLRIMSEISTNAQVLGSFVFDGSVFDCADKVWKIVNPDSKVGGSTFVPKKDFSSSNKGMWRVNLFPFVNLSPATNRRN